MTEPFNHDLWPKARFSLWDLARPKSSIAEIEEFFSDRYGGTPAVLAPSGRSALNLGLSYLGLSRPDEVWIPPFSSHCVINAVGYSCTPTTVLDHRLKAAICFHQWGFPKKIETSAPIIEDSVDSLITSTQGLFPNDGRFEILSLSKIFGSICGGIILCQKEKDAHALRRMRECQKGFGNMHFALRVVGQASKTAYSYWNAAEPLNRATPSALTANIWKYLQRLDSIIADRLEKLEYLQDASISLAAPIGKDRLPVCWPVSVKSASFESAMPPEVKRFMLPSSGANELKQVYPIPIHQDVALSSIRSWIEKDGRS